MKTIAVILFIIFFILAIATGVEMFKLAFQNPWILFPFVPAACGFTAWFINEGSKRLL